VRANKQTGFTIIEVLIVIFMTVLILTALFTLFDWHNRIYYLEQAEVKATGSARASLVRLEKHIVQARRVLASRTVGGVDYTSGSTTIILEIPTINSSNEVVANTYDYAVYYLSGNALYERIEANGASIRKSGLKQLSDAVNTLTLTYNNEDFAQVSVVTVNLQTRARARNTHVNTELAQTVFLRNY
jgi:type II secretory pathway component PulJ